MSLINDALNRARAETADREAGAGNLPPAHSPHPTPSRDGRRGIWPAVAVVLLLLVVALIARRWTASDDHTIEASTTPNGESTVSTPAPDRTEPVTTPNEASAETMSVESPPEVDAVPLSDPVTDVEADPARSTAQPPTAMPTGNGSSRAQPASQAPTDSAPTAADPQLAAAELAQPERDAPELVAPELDAPRPADALVVETPITRAVDEPSTSLDRPSEATAPTDQETWYYVGSVDLAGGGKITLGGIAWSESAPSAMLNGSLLGIGSDILGLRVVGIAPRTVTLAGRGQRIALQIGAQPPAEAAPEPAGSADTDESLEPLAPLPVGDG